MGPRVGVDVSGEEEKSCWCLDSNPDRPAQRLVTILTELSRVIVRVYERATGLTV